MVDIPADVLRLVYSGSTNGGHDTWNCVVHVKAAGPEIAFNDSELDALRDAWTNHIFHDSHLESAFSVSTTYDLLSIYVLDTTNHAIDMTSDATAEPVTGTGTAALPSEVSVCCSSVTGKPGRSYNGRMYLPGIDAVTLQADGTISFAQSGFYASAVAAFYQAIDNVTYADDLGTLTCGVLSLVKGVITPIIGVKVGNILDVQRRRRNGAPEVYNAAVVVPT